MINANQIIRRADRDGVDAQTVERDYVIAHVVAQLHHAVMPGGGRLVFKGGTALRLVHAPGYRYSADLDFTVLDGTIDDAHAALSEAVEAARAHAGFPMLELRSRESDPPLLAYIGPLGASKQRMIKVDFADDEYVETVGRGSVLPDLWNDLPDPAADFDVYPLGEIAAEKLRCIIQRALCRDLYDLYELTQGLSVDLGSIHSLFEAKARAKGIDPSIFPRRFGERIDRLKDRWDVEMKDLVSDPPRLEDVERILRRHLRAADLI